MHQAHNFEEAYDALCELPGQPLPADARFHCLATQGMLRHAQWAAAQRAAAADMPGAAVRVCMLWVVTQTVLHMCWPCAWHVENSRWPQEHLRKSTLAMQGMLGFASGLPCSCCRG